MAINDIKISQLPELDETTITDDTMLSSIKGILNYALPMDVVAEYIKGKLAHIRALGEMSLSTTSAPQTFSGSSFQTVEAFDKVQYERNVDIDTTTNTITISRDGDYSVSVGINAAFDNTQGAEFALMVDGAVFESLGTIQGRGVNKPVYIGGVDIDPFTAGQVITLGAKDEDGGDVDITFHKVRIIISEV